MRAPTRSAPTLPISASGSPSTAWVATCDNSRRSPPPVNGAAIARTYRHRAALSSCSRLDLGHRLAGFQFHLRPAGNESAGRQPVVCAAPRWQRTAPAYLHAGHRQTSGSQHRRGAARPVPPPDQIPLSASGAELTTQGRIGPDRTTRPPHRPSPRATLSQSCPAGTIRGGRWRSLQLPCGISLVFPRAVTGSNPVGTIFFPCNSGCLRRLCPLTAAERAQLGLRRIHVRETAVAQEPLGKCRTHRRVSSKTTTAPSSKTAATCPKFASSNLTCTSGRRGPARLRRITDGFFDLPPAVGPLSMRV